jgi:hypothetical protein
MGAAAVTICNPEGNEVECISSDSDYKEGNEVE